MAKMSPSEYEEFKRKTGYKESDHPVKGGVDTGREHHPNRQDWEEEKERKGRVNKKIDEDINRVKHRQEDTESAAYWKEHNKIEDRKKEKQREKEREAEEDRQDERTRERATNRRAPHAARGRSGSSKRGSGGSRAYGSSGLGGAFSVGDFSSQFGSGGISFGGYSDPFASLRGSPGRSSSGLFGDLSGGLFSSGGRGADPLSGLRSLSLGSGRGVRGGIFTGYSSPFAGMFSAPAPRKRRTIRRKKKIVTRRR